MQKVVRTYGNKYIGSGTEELSELLNDGYIVRHITKMENDIVEYIVEKSERQENTNNSEHHDNNVLHVSVVSGRFSKEDLKDAFEKGIDIGYKEGANHGEPTEEEVIEYFNKWLNNR